MKYKCPCCGFYTFDEEPDGNYDICPVCFWEDDSMAYDDVFEKCSCNRVSLIEARENYKKVGACRKDMVSYVRKPLKNELNGNSAVRH